MKKEKYTILRPVGEGAFGEVFQIRWNKNEDEDNLKTKNIIDESNIYAMKKIRITQKIPQSIFNEMKALQHLQHPHIVQLYNIDSYDGHLVFIMEYMETNLAQIIKNSQCPFSSRWIKTIMQMLLRGIASCHDHSILHRDLKPGNILVNSKGVLKIGDFGQACVFDRKEKRNSLNPQVATRWYRAPELLFGSTKYGPSVDMYAIGVIFAELLNQAVLFPGQNDIDQIYRLVQVLGHPKRTWPDVENCPDYSKISFPDFPPLPIESIVPNASEIEVSFLKKMLVYNPEKRCTAKEALQDDYFFTHPLPEKCINLDQENFSWPLSTSSCPFEEWINLPSSIPSIPSILPSILPSSIPSSSIPSSILPSINYSFKK